MSTAISTTLSDPSRRSWIWRVAAAVTLLIFLWQWDFFLGNTFGGLVPERVWGYAVHHAYILAWLLLVTSFTRTVPLRTLATFWFVGVFPVMALTLLVTEPINDLFAGGQLSSALFGPLWEDLIKPLPVFALFAYRAWRGGWQMSATDGLLLGFVVGAGFAFHEDAGYNRVWGDGWDAPWGLLFPTLGSSRSALLPGHDVLTALVGLAIGFAFLYRRYRFAWVLPLAAWLIVVAEHITGNLADISGALPLPAEIIRGLLFGGQALPALLLSGIAVTVFLELRILRSIERQDPLFPPIASRDLLKALQQRTTAGLRGLQAKRVYARQRRSLYYTVWTRAMRPEALATAAARVYELGRAAGGSVEEAFEAHDRVEAPPTREPPAASATGTAVP
ncbi:MAG: PrsW family glutamic-type intramembrane protease [Candidatus Limnocylindria bacterium]